MNYEEILRNIYSSFIDYKIDVCETSKQRTLSHVEAALDDKEEYEKLEELIDEDFENSTFSGFCAGFKCASILFTGSKHF